MTDPTHVKVDGKVYRVVGFYAEPSRGREWKLSPGEQGDGLVHRMCYAVAAGKSCFTHGNRLEGRPHKMN